MIELLISLVVFCLIFGLIWWILGELPLPEPFGRIARVVVVVIGCIVLIYFLLGFVGHTPRLGRP